MNYDTIILEMLSRIQTLEQQVEDLKVQINMGGVSAPAEKVSTQDIQNYIEKLKSDAEENGEKCLQLKANDIHKALRLKSRFPMVCNAMRKCMQTGDEVIFETPSGYSSTLEIKYHLGNKFVREMKYFSYDDLVENFESNPRDVHTLPLTQKPKWFFVFVDKGALYVQSGRFHAPDNSNIYGSRLLDPEEYNAVLELYQRRRAGENVSLEANTVTQNQSYWFGIFAELNF